MPDSVAIHNSPLFAWMKSLAYIAVLSGPYVSKLFTFFVSRSNSHTPKLDVPARILPSFVAKIFSIHFEPGPVSRGKTLQALKRFVAGSYCCRNPSAVEIHTCSPYTHIDV